MELLDQKHGKRQYEYTAVFCCCVHWLTSEGGIVTGADTADNFYCILTYSFFKLQEKVPAKCICFTVLNTACWVCFICIEESLYSVWRFWIYGPLFLF